MKLFKYLLLLFVGIGFAACDDDDVKVNTASDVTVEFASDSLITQEGVALAQIPVVINGEPNGKVKVTIEVRQADNADEPAIEDVHYYVTTKQLWIYPDTKEADFEIVPIDDRDQGEGRTFIITITSAEGAQVGTQSQAIGFIRDNDSDTYDRLGGEWTVTFNDSYDGEVSVSAVIETYAFDKPQYKRMLMATADWMGFGADGTIDLTYSAAGRFVGLMANSLVIGPVNFTNYGPCNIFTGVNVNGQPSLSGSIPGNWNDDLTEINFGDGLLYMLVVGAEGNEIVGENTLLGPYSTWDNIRFTRSLED